MGPTELVQCLSAAARVKYYDGSFLQDLLIPQIQQNLTKTKSTQKMSPFATDELVGIVCSLADLNCFDKVIFDACVRELADKKHQELYSPDRTRLLDAFKAAKYDCGENRDFLEWLCASVRAERYEAASIEQRMIVGNSRNGMHAPEGYLRSFMVGTTSNGVEVRRPHGLTS